MSEYDLHSKILIVHVVPPAAIAVDTNGAIVDTLGYDSLEYVLHVGTAFVGGGYDVTIREDDLVAFATSTALGAAETLGALPSIVITDANAVFRVGSIGKKRFSRITLTETDTITGGVIGVTAILSNPRVTPEADQSVS
jgi:hypothetical protein